MSYFNDATGEYENRSPRVWRDDEYGETYSDQEPALRCEECGHVLNGTEMHPLCGECLEEVGRECPGCGDTLLDDQKCSFCDVFNKEDMA